MFCRVQSPGGADVRIVEEIAGVSSAATKSETIREKCGGQSSMDATKHLSEEVGKIVRRNLGAGGSPCLQPAIFQGMGLEHMLTHAAVYKKRFDSLCADLEAKLRRADFKAAYWAASVKSIASAAGKVATTYHGNCRQLTDIVRGTMVIQMTPGPDGFKKAYGALKEMVGAEKELAEAHGKFVNFTDRYQQPAGQYSDWKFLLRVSDFVCELQVNFEEAVKQKEDELHRTYEMDRLGKRKLLQAAMAGDIDMALLLMKAEVPVEAVDHHGYTPLHYAARHGLAPLVRSLLAAGADVYSVDADGHTSLYHAAVMGHIDAARLLLEAMEKDTSRAATQAPLGKMSLHRVWATSAEHFAADSGMIDRVQSLAAAAFANLSEQLFFTASSGDVRCMQLLLQKPVPEVTCRFSAEMGSTGNLLDYAVMSCSAPMVDVVLAADLYLHRSCLHDGMHAAGNIASSLRSDDGSHFMALAHYWEKTRVGLNMSVLPGCLHSALLHHNYQLAQAIASQGITLDSLAYDEKVKLVSVVGDAAGKGEDALVQVLIRSGAPIHQADPFNGYMPLHRAAFSGHSRICEVLVEGRADVNVIATGPVKIPPVACSVYSSMADTVKVLIELRADIEASGPDRWWESALGQAVLFDLGPMARLLKALGADASSAQWRLHVRRERAVSVAAALGMEV